MATVVTVRSEATGTRAEAPGSIAKIRAAALQSFAAHGTGATTLRGVAAAAGVSLGLVQHHFATKAGLIKAVDDYVVEIVINPLAEPVSESTADSVSEIGHRVTSLFVEHPEVAGYLGRALVDGSPLGARIFDLLYEVGEVRWQQRADRGETRPDIDLPWAVINALILPLGAISMREHVERHLCAPFTAPEQLQRWREAVNVLLRDGLFRKA